MEHAVAVSMHSHSMAYKTRTRVTLLHVSDDARDKKHCTRRNTTEAEDPKPRGVAIVVTHARNNALSRKARKTPLAL